MPEQPRERVVAGRSVLQTHECAQERLVVGGKIRHVDAGLATSGTTSASALALRTSKAALEQVLTKDNFVRVDQLENRLSNGLNDIFKRHGRPWQSFSIGARAGYCMTPDLPKNYAEAQLSLHDEFVDARRVFMANRGIWDAIATAGPGSVCAQRNRCRSVFDRC